MPPEYMDRDARLARIEEQGLDGAWLFPTLGVLYEDRMKDDIEAVCTTFGAFNRWLDEDWGLSYDGHASSPRPTSRSPTSTGPVAELEWALDRDARIVVMRPAAVWTRTGPRNRRPTRMFDPFWARVNEAGITVVVAHVSNSGYDTNGYDPAAA